MSNMTARHYIKKHGA